MNLKHWLHEQRLSVRELARQLELPLPTVEGWVYGGTLPTVTNLETLNIFISATCAHHWLIDRPNGPLSEGVCQRCGERREFMNSEGAASSTVWLTTQRLKAQ